MSKYPHIMKASEAIANDLGYNVAKARSMDFDGIDCSTEMLGDKDVDRSAVEADLASLSEEDLQTIAVGDEDQWVRIYATMKHPEQVHAMLEGIFAHND